MFRKLPCQEILKQTLSRGGDFSELFFEHSSKTSIVHEDKKIEKVVSGIDCGVGLRLIHGLKTAYGYSNDLSKDKLTNLSSLVSSAAKEGSFDKTIQLRTIKPSLVFPVAIDPSRVPLQQKIEMVEMTAKRAWALDKRIVQVKAGYSDTHRQVQILNSEGELVDFTTTLTVLSLSISASEGNELQRGYHSIGGHLGYELFDEKNIEWLTSTAVRRALLNLKASRAEGGTMPVVISSSAGGTMVHEALGHGLEADLACEGLSVYEGKMGREVASSKVTVVEDPTLPGKRGSFSFDDEGTPAQKVILIERGILKNYMHSRLSAKKMGLSSNGHGRRESYAFRPIVRMANTMISPGTDNPEEIVRSVDRGLYVKMMGGGQVNTVNGDFIFEVSEGYRMEHGKIGEPVRGATLTGNGPEVIKTIDRVGSDSGFSIGTCGKDGQWVPVADAMPTVLIPEMVVGGMV